MGARLTTPEGIFVLDESGFPKQGTKSGDRRGLSMASRQPRSAPLGRARERRAQVGTGDRSQKVRTYNFPQNRVTDHRIHFTTHSVDQVLDGKLDDLIAAVKQAQEKERLSA